MQYNNTHINMHTLSNLNVALNLLLPISFFVNQFCLFPRSTKGFLPWLFSIILSIYQYQNFLVLTFTDRNESLTLQFQDLLMESVRDKSENQPDKYKVAIMADQKSPALR